MDANNLLVESRVLQSGLLPSDKPARWMRDGRDRLLLLPSSLLDFCALLSRSGVNTFAHREERNLVCYCLLQIPELNRES